MLLRRLLVVISVLLAGSAWALTPGQLALLFSGIKPVFQVDLTQGALPGQISFSRASNKECWNSAGVLTLISTNVPCFDYNPSTLAPLGLLIEEQRTNVVLQNRNLSNASWTKTNITAAQDQTGIDGVANSASSILATAGNGTVLQAITLASSQRFQTAYVQRITGSGVVNMTTDGGATWTAITIPGAGTWGRVSIPAQTVTNPSVGFQLVTNTDKIAVDFVQNETGAFATSPIATTTVSVVRSADVAQLTGQTYTPAYSVVVEGDSVASFQRMWSTAPVSLGAFTSLTWQGTTITLGWNGSSGSSLGTFASNSIARVAGTWTSVGGWSASLNGAAALTGTNSDYTGLATSGYLGSQGGTSVFLDGHIRKFALYNTRLPNSALQTKSVVGAPF